MLRTLIAHWHRDAVGYNRGSLGDKAMALAWNLISRGIGFIVRSATLFVWAASACAAAGLSMAGLTLFVLWPLLSIAGIFIGAAGLV